MIKLIQSTEEFIAIQSQWGALVEKTNAHHPFYLWDWFYTWWMHFNNGKTLYIITSWDGDQMNGAWPLVLNKFTKKMMPIRALCNLGENEVDISGWIIPNNDPTILSQMVTYLMKMRKKWDVIDVHDIPFDSIKDLPLNLFFDNRYEIAYQQNRHLYIPINSSWEDYFNSRSSELRKKIRKSQRSLSKDFTQNFINHSKVDIPEALIGDLVAISNHSKFPMLHQNNQIDFIKDLFKKIVPDFTILYLYNEPAAYDYGFIYHNSVYNWRRGYDLKFGNYSIGQILMANAVERCFLEGREMYDFLRGDEWYKHQWSTGQNIFINLRIIRKRFSPLVVYSWTPRLAKKLRRQELPDEQKIIEAPWDHLSTQRTGTWKELVDSTASIFEENL